MTTETWRVIDEAGAVHEIEVGQVRGSAAWCARVRPYEAPVIHSDPRGAVVIAAMRDGVGIAEVLAPGAVSREEMADEVAHLEDRRGALLAEVDRLHALDRDAGVVIEDLRKMLAAADADLAAARDDAATARADGAREMRERAAKACEAVMDAQPRSSLGDVAMCCRADVLSLPLPGEGVAPPKVCGFCNGRGMVAYGREVEDACEACCEEVPEAPAPQSVAWGAMPTTAEVEARCEGRAESRRGAAPWMRRHTDTSGDFVEVLYLRAINGLTYFRSPSGGVWYLMREEHEASRWRPIDDDGAVAQEVARG